MQLLFELWYIILRYMRLPNRHKEDVLDLADIQPPSRLLRRWKGNYFWILIRLGLAECLC